MFTCLFPCRITYVLDRGLNSFQILVNETIEEQEKTLESLSRDDIPAGTANRYQNLMRNIRECENQHGHDLDSLIPIIASSSADLRSACENGVTYVIDWLQEYNSHRLTSYFLKPDTIKARERHDKLVDQLNKLQAALEEYRSVHRNKLIQPYERFFDPNTRRLLKNPNQKDIFVSRYVYLECFSSFTFTMKKFS